MLTVEENAKVKKEYIKLLIRIMILAAAGWVMLTQIFLVMQASDNGMFPAVKAGDLLIGFRLEKSFQKDDVVVYEKDGKRYVGRVIGKESDVITMDESGTLIVNGTDQSGEIAFPSYPKKILCGFRTTVFLYLGISEQKQKTAAILAVFHFRM